MKQIAELADLGNLKALRAGGAIGDPKQAVAIAINLPWLLGRGASLGIVSQMHAVTLANKPAIHDRNGTLTWKQLDRRANRALHALHGLGIGSRGRVGMLLRNGREFAEVTIAAQKGGMNVCPLNTWAKKKELAATIEAIDPDVLVYDVAHAAQVAAAAPGELALVAVGATSRAIPGSLAYEEWIGSASASPTFPISFAAASPRVVIQTSGTTGTPKGASRDSSVAGLGALARMLQVVPYHRTDVILCPTPMFHSFGLATLSFACGLGATVVAPDRFDPEDTLRSIERHRVTALSLVPVMIRRIVSLDEEVKARYDLGTVRILLASGSAMGRDLRAAATGLFGDVLYDLYGSTEAGWVAIATPEDIRSRPGSIGRPSPGVEVAIFDADGNRLGPGETGEIFVRSDIRFEGYTSGENKTERDGYMGIGDLGHLDEDGYLFVESRADDMVIVGGENVYPIEVEDLITSMPGVGDAAVVGLDDDEYGKVLAAFVEGSVSEDDVRTLCERELASYKVPKRIEVLDELPRTSTGKVLKRELIARVGTAD